VDANRFDTIARLFADRRSRRQAVIQGGAGLAAGAIAVAGLHGHAGAQEATPIAAGDATPSSDATPSAAVAGEEKTSQTLFLQAFQSGSIAPKPDADGHYVLTLEHGLGQTVFFTDRPERVVGVTPTAEFLANVGFSETDPPNAAIVVEKTDGDTEIAVIELIDPKYDQATHTATYEVAVLKEWERALGVGFDSTPTDLSAFGESFGAAHLFIDDCADGTVTCNAPSAEGGYITINAGFCYVNGCCQPCTDGSDPHTYWATQCQIQEPGACQCGPVGYCPDPDANHCTVDSWDSWLIPCGY
jgi:hypothetical protein